MTPLPARVQLAILSRMDRVSFRVSKFPLVKDATVRANATTSNTERDAFRLIGDSIFLALTTKVVNANDELRLSEHREVVIQALRSPSTCARLLLAMGHYDQKSGEPWYGMDSPAVGDAFRVYLGTYAASAKCSMLQLSTWFRSIFDLLAAGAARGLDPKAQFRRPQKPTRLAHLHVSETAQYVKKPRIATILQGKVALAEITNSAANPRRGKKAKAAANVTSAIATTSAKPKKQRTAKATAVPASRPEGAIVSLASTADRQPSSNQATPVPTGSTAVPSQ
ncbi:hypothetical protein FB451DRAFT_1399594 [Mycena latifolia]|nr:hypothetical protein FB451DRAFT_1399594 [Mycena latifolia]